MAGLPRTYLFGIIIFTFIIVGGVTMLNSFESAATTPVATAEFEAFNSNFNRLQKLETEIGNLESKVTNASIDQGEFGTINSLITTTWQGIKLITINFDFMDASINALNQPPFNIPTWATSLILLLITVMIIFSIIGAILQWYL